MTVSLRVATIAVAAAALTLVSVPAFAQIDLSGGWQSLEHEDWIERAPGCDPVDYPRRGVRDAGRARARIRPRRLHGTCAERRGTREGTVVHVRATRDAGAPVSLLHTAVRG